MKTNPTGYTLPFVLAIVFHGVLLAILLTPASSSTGTYQVAAADDVKIVQAVAIDQSQVDAEIENINAERQAQADAQAAKQQALEQQAERARQQRLAEEQQLAELEQQRQAQAERQAREQQQVAATLEELKQQQQQQQQHLEETQRQQRLAEQQRQQAERLAEQQQAETLAAQAQAEQQAAEQTQQRQQQEQAQQQARQQQLAGEINRYKALIVQSISRHWIIPDNVDNSLSSQFEIRLARDGTILSVRLIRSSGDTILDRSAETAIYNASPLPVPNDEDTFETFRVLNLTVRPEEVLSGMA